MKFRNLDKAPSFSLLHRVTPSITLTEERIASCEVNAGARLTYNFATKPASEEVIELLGALAQEQELVDKLTALATGEVMNSGEERRVLHHLLRGEIAGKVIVDGMDMAQVYRSECERLLEFAGRVRSGELRGSKGHPFRDVVQIGIGGSDLGPRALYIALKDLATAETATTRKLNAHFISNVDPDDTASQLSGIDLESALFILVSKSGTTQETLTNIELVKRAMRSVDGLRPSDHIIAVTSRTSPLASSDEVLDSFYIDDSIGGRYSATSAVGGCILGCSLGPEVFRALLEGAHEADLLATNTDIRSNASLLDAMIGVYERSVLGYRATAVLPYSQALARFPAHLQQLDMESNGKRINRAGQPVAYPTGPVVFGEPGTNGQHSFYQLLHQGTDVIPLQFIGFKESQTGHDAEIDGATSQSKLNANLAAQIVAFASGKNDENRNKEFPGGRPSSLLFGKRLTPAAMGALLAHFENKIAFQGFAWNLNSFDQEGVQLGKVLASSLLSGTGSPELLAYAHRLGLSV